MRLTIELSLEELKEHLINDGRDFMYLGLRKYNKKENKDEDYDIKVIKIED